MLMITQPQDTSWKDVIFFLAFMFFILVMWRGWPWKNDDD